MKSGNHLNRTYVHHKLELQIVEHMFGLNHMILRNFLYLDNDTVDDYLSQIEGSLIDGLDQTRRKDRRKNAKGDVKIASGEVENTEGAERRETRRITPQAKFQRLYKYLDEEDGIQYLDAFDEGIWNQIGRNEILEIPVNISIPRSMQLLQSVPNIKSLIPLMELLNSDSKSNKKDNLSSEQISEVLNYLSSDISEKPLTIVFTAINTPSFKFVGDLSKNFLKSKSLDTNIESTMLCKVLRSVPEGACIEISGLMDDLFKMQKLTNAPKASIQKSKKGFMEQGLIDRINGPVMKVLPIAIYR